MYLFFDTETTGTPKRYNAPISDLNNRPRVIQLAWVLYDNDRQIVDQSCTLIKPDGWEMPTDKFWIDNGFTQLKNEMDGEPIRQALSRFIIALDQTKYLIAHNIKFDTPIVQAEMIRAQVAAGNKPEKICTMESTTDLCKIPGSYGYKWPKLIELHKHLFGEGFDGAHDALEDVRASARCFFKLIELGYLKAA